ncbi:MAG: tRNA pseudouridine(54/55) synthase Pus10 [Halobacteriota archaeon]
MTVLTDARALLDTGAVCDTCLGRCFGDQGSGLSVAERGHALRVACAVADDEPYHPVAPTDCWVCDGATTVDFDEWADRAAAALSDLEFESFQVGTRPPETVAKNERTLRTEAGLPENAGVTFNAVVNREVGDRLERRIGASRDTDRPDVVVVLDLVATDVEVRITPRYVYGRYRKLVAGVAQRVRKCPECGGTETQSLDDGDRVCETCDGSGRLPSVEEIVAWSVRDALDAAEVVFHTAGREADDVLVLGTGRPFVVEVKEPRRRVTEATDLRPEIEAAAADRVAVDELTLVDSDAIGRVSGLPFRQRYRVTVTTRDPIPAGGLRDAVTRLAETTIRRHVRMEELREGRRPTEVVRKLQNVDGEWIADWRSAVEFEVAAGIDPESVVTGEDGRTEPSLSELLKTDLDVTEVAIVAVEARDGSFEKPSRGDTRGRTRRYRRRPRARR